MKYADLRFQHSGPHGSLKFQSNSIPNLTNDAAETQKGARFIFTDTSNVNLNPGLQTPRSRYLLTSVIASHSQHNAELNVMVYNEWCYLWGCPQENRVEMRKQLKSIEQHHASYSRIFLHLPSISYLCFLLPHAVLRTVRSHLVYYLLLNRV